MKAISLWQPWASLVVCGAKKIETRSWATKVRGTVAIHATKKDPHSIMILLPHDVAKAIYDSLYKKLGIQSGALERMVTGHILGTVDIVDCVKIEYRSNHLPLLSPDVECKNTLLENGTIVTDPELLFGDYTPGRFAWILDNPVIFDKPIPAKGRQGFWNWEEVKT